MYLFKKNIFKPTKRNHQNRDVVSLLPEDLLWQQLGWTDNGIYEDNSLLV